MASERGVHHVRRGLEQTAVRLVLLAGAPAIAVLLVILWREPYSFEARWTILTLTLAVWIACAAAVRRIASRTLYLIANLLGALREGDYSIRGVGGQEGSAVDLVMHEVNALGETLQRQRREAIESTALLTSVMSAIDVAVFAFDPEARLALVNRAGERLLSAPAKDLVDRSAAEMGFEPYLSGETPRLVERAFASERGRWELRRTTFWREGRPHQLVVFSDLSRALREEEQAAWQRIVRVLSHEINNSLTPIKSLAHSLRRIVEREPGLSRGDEIAQGLALIETRSGGLSRFLRSYAQLARLPKLQRRPVHVGALVRRVADLEKRATVAVSPSPEMRIQADQDQLEQLLINIVRNAVDASTETGGAVHVRWRRTGEMLELDVEDEGPGLPDTKNLFVPFFTTKPNGSGIGLALSRQIAEAHGGGIELENRADRRGCRARVTLPVEAPETAALSA